MSNMLMKLGSGRPWHFSRESSSVMSAPREISLHPLSAAASKSFALDETTADASFRFFFETLPIPGLLFNFSSVRKYFERLASSGLDISEFFAENPEDAAACLGLSSLVAINAKAIPFFTDKLGSEGQWDLRFLSSVPLDFLLLRVLLGFWRGETEFSYEDLVLRSGAEAHYGNIHLACPSEARDSWKLVFISIVDRSEARRLENELRGVAEEKSLLLKELQHRVKNNLAIIDSFISLERLSCGDERLCEALVPISARIQSMANAYDLLSGNGAQKGLDVGDYLKSIVGNVCDLAEAHSGPVRLAVSCEELPLDIDSTMRLGLVVDEFALNSLKYAFPDIEWPEGWTPRISVALRACLTGGGEPSYCLVYSDNGVGLPEGFDYAREEELGLKAGKGGNHGLGHLLVRALLEQLGAKLAVGPLAEGKPRGLRFEIRFGKR